MKYYYIELFLQNNPKKGKLDRLIDRIVFLFRVYLKYGVKMRRDKEGDSAFYGSFYYGYFENERSFYEIREKLRKLKRVHLKTIETSYSNKNTAELQPPRERKKLLERILNNED